jgi:excisionase family DNA binding protein
MLESRLADLGAPSNGSAVPTTTNAPDAYQQLLTPEQFAELLQVAPRTLQRLRHLGEVPKPIEVGGSLRWRKRDVDRWMERRAR